MPFEALTVRSGVNVDFTPLKNEAGISVSSLIRFRDGLPEKLGGWAKFYPAPYASVPRALQAWEGLNDDTHLAVGCEASLNVISSGASSDITPRIAIDNVTPNFSTTSGSNIVTIVDTGSDTSALDVLVLNTPISVGGLILSGSYQIFLTLDADTYEIQAASNATATVANGGSLPVFESTIDTSAVEVNLTAHNLSVGDTVPFVAPTMVGGVTVQGLYTVNSVVDADNFVINVANQAASTDTETMNGDLAQLVYQIAIGPQPIGAGYGIGGYGLGGYGTGVVSPVRPGNPVTTSDWTLDNYGNILVACPEGGPVYTWQPSSGFGTAQILFPAPIANDGLFVAMPQQILVTWGASVLGVQDPLLIAWSDSGNLQVWTAATDNQAGTFRIPTGSKVVGGIQAPQQGLIWTDIDLYSMMYIGYPGVFGFNRIAKGCGLAGRHAMGILNGLVYWMNPSQFYALTGSGAQPIPCPIWDEVFQNLDTANLQKIRCATNSGFNEVAWHFPSLAGGTGENDTYAKLNVLTGEWDYGPMSRTAWTDQSLFGPPIGGAPTGYIYQHEISNDADGVAMNPSFTTGYASISSGSDMTFVDWFHPDFKYQKTSGTSAATLQITLFAKDYPNVAPRTYGPFTVTASLPYFNPRVRGRYVAMQVQSDDLGTWWRLGSPRIRAAPDGKR